MENNLLKYFVLVCLLAMSNIITAQTGTIRGSVIEDSTGEALIGVAVAIQGTTTGTGTDFDGAFEMNLDPGIYNLELSYITFQNSVITDIVVKAGELTLLNNIRMVPEGEQLDEIVISAEVVRNNEAALMTIKRRSTNLMDGISSAKFKKIGDSNAAAAVKRVTGVSVEGGKYVYVRGLGDRYTKTMLNSVDIPGLDPDRNSLQIDIFPTNLINNMIVYKSALAELPADFTGGVVNIETKDFPEKKIFDVSVGLGYNPSMHLNSEYLQYEGGSTDWLGFDDGARELPSAADQAVIPSPVSGSSSEQVGSFLREFNPTLAATETTSLPDFSLGLSIGNQFTLKNDHKFGFILSTSYKSSRNYYNNVSFGEYQKQVGSDVYDLLYATTQEGRLAEENILLAGLAGLAYKTNRTKHKVTFMHLQNGESKAGRFFIDNNSDAIGQSGYTANSTNLEYSQRGLTNIFLNGEYRLGADNEWEIDWRISPTLSTLIDPDIRKTAFSYFAGDNQQFIAGAGGNPSRIWRYLDELNLVTRVDLSRDYKFNGQDAKIKAGFYHLFKERDYRILSYDMQFFGLQPDWTGNPAEVLTEDNIYPNGTIYYVSGNNTPNPNEYNSKATNIAAYITNELNPYSSLKATVGLRIEKFEQRHTGRDVEFANFGTGNNLVDETVLEATDLFPSLNLIQSLKENQNLRFSYARSIARPSFKELSFAQIIDPITDRIFNGSLFEYNDWDGKITETRINNFDLRWEYFMTGGQIFSVSGFYKSFDNPIELVRIPAAQTSNEFQPRNVGDGEVYGVEIELRKNLSFLSSNLEKLSLSGNITVVESIIQMTELEFNSRESFQKEGEILSDTRDMAGQAPYIINAGISYNNPDNNLDLGFYYNVKGRTLAVVGGGLFPDVYAKPFHSLKFSLNKSLGTDNRTSISFEIDNILNSKIIESFTGYNAEDQIFSRFEPGVTFGLGLKYAIL